MNFKLASIGLVMLVGCGGGGALDPGAGDDPGTGTNTLYVEGRITAGPVLVPATKDTDFATEFEIRLSNNNAPLGLGTVTVKSRHATTNLTYQGENNGLGIWSATAANYDEVYQLDVVSSEDEIRSVIVDGPDIHTFTKPTAGESLDSTMAIAVEWDRGEEADTATFKTENIDRITIPDSGDYSMPPGSLKAENDKTKTNTIELRRANSVVPAGAVAGSSVSVSITNTIDVIALANPAL